MAAPFFFFVFIFPSIVTASITFSNYTQTINHFGVGGPYDNITFPQLYAVDDTYWSGAEKNAPILVVFGGEKAMRMTPIGSFGVVTQAAPLFHALVLYIEHRFYGTSVPFGSFDAAFASPLLRSYLSSEQALADYAEIILSVKATFAATHSPVIVIGPSYAGMLAAWFRLKYPHIAIGALASSAPMLSFKDVPPENDFCSIVTRDFEHVDEKCANIIRQSWRVIDEIASGADGLGVLTKTFNLCGSLSSTDELKVLLTRMYSFAAQYNGPHNFWINSVCHPIVELSSSPNRLEGVAWAFSVMNNKTCPDLESVSEAPTMYDLLDNNSFKAWRWQQCSEIIAILGCNGDDSMLPPEAFDNVTQYIEDCSYSFQAVPRLNWEQTYYGGRDIKAGSNIIFSNGLMDPLSSFGILDDVSDTIIAIPTKQGSHCLDLSVPHKNDPRWLMDQRRKEIMIFRRWLTSETSQRFSGKIAIICNLLALIIVVVYLVQ